MHNWREERLELILFNVKGDRHKIEGITFIVKTIKTKQICIKLLHNIHSTNVLIYQVAYGGIFYYIGTIVMNSARNKAGLQHNKISSSFG